MPFNFTMPQYQPPQLGGFAPNVGAFAPNMRPFSLALQPPPPSQQLIPTLQAPTAANVTGVRMPQGLPSLGGPQPPTQEPPGGGLGGKAADPGTGHYGPLGQTFSNVLGGVRTGLSLGGLMSGLLGASVASGVFGGLGQIAGFLGVSSTIAELLGAKPGFDATLGMPTEADFQGVRDVHGAFAEKAARDQAARDMDERQNQRQNEFDTMQATGMGAATPDATSTGETDTSNDGEAGRGGGID